LIIRLHLIGDGQQRFRDGGPSALAVLRLITNLELGRLLNRQIASLLALENPASIFAHHLKDLVSVRSVAWQGRWPGRTRVESTWRESQALPRRFYWHG
jgi:hypothetical protein